MIRKIIFNVISILLLVIIALALFIEFSWNKTYDWPGPSLQSSTDSAVIAKGRYLVHGPAHCVSCHVSGFDALVAGDEGKEVPLSGGIQFPMGPLGNLYTPNLTPHKTTGIGRYTDEQLFRMMRHSVKPNGTGSLSLLMPFNQMADDDLVAIVSYLRSMAPVNNPVPEPSWTMMGKAVRVFTPTFKPIRDPVAPKQAPAMAATVERGEYLARYVANCVGCHTQRDPMTYEATGPEFAGGMEFEPWPQLHNYLKVDPELWLRTPNLTPDPNSAFARFKTPEAFVERFRKGRIISYSAMDWGPFSRMSDEDIKALWMYLNSLPPVKKDVGEIVFKKAQQ